MGFGLGVKKINNLLAVFKCRKLDDLLPILCNFMAETFRGPETA